MKLSVFPVILSFLSVTPLEAANTIDQVPEEDGVLSWQEALRDPIVIQSIFVNQDNGYPARLRRFYRSNEANILLGAKIAVPVGLICLWYYLDTE